MVFQLALSAAGFEFPVDADIADAGAHELERIVAGQFAKGDAAAAVNRARRRTRCPSSLQVYNASSLAQAGAHSSPALLAICR